MNEKPVYSVKIPEYRIRALTNLSGKMHMTEWGHPVPQEYEDNKPDFTQAGSRIVETLREPFQNQKLALRLLSSSEHPEKSIEELIEIITTLGHDRYDPERPGDRYENIDNKKIDFFALELETGNPESEADVGHALRSFYYWPVFTRDTPPVRVDLGVLYDLNQVEIIEHRYEGREHQIKRDGFIFKYPDRKPEAVLALLKIL